MSLARDLANLRQAYHKIIKYEYEKRQRSREVFLTKEEIQKNLGIDEEIFRALVNEGFLIEIEQNSFRSLLMDLAYRIADIRLKRGGTKYVLESPLDLRMRPILNPDFVKFDVNDENLSRLKEEFSKIVGKDLVEKLLEAFVEAELRGLSRYQFLSILKFLKEGRKDVIICAPTAFGKTYIFLIPILLFVVKNLMEGRRGTFAVLFYPRKSLGSDQMGRIIRLVQQINDKLKIRITVGIDDGDTKYSKDVEDGEEYRGIRCPRHRDEKLVIRKRGGSAYCSCSQCGELDFIKATKDEISSDPPNILITNIWTYQRRLCEPDYWKSGYLSESIQFFVFDEVHAYRSVVAGVLRYFIRILKSLVSREARLVISSATIPKLEEFIQEISGQSIDDFVKLVYSESEHGKDGEKLELYLLLGINPLTSWETYVHELAIFLSTVNRIRNRKNVQSLIFVDSVRSILRLYTEALEALKLGDPKDHLRRDVSPTDPFCYWVYNEEFRLTRNDDPRLDKLRDQIANNIATHYSDKADRFEVEERIKSGNIDVVFTTSTLELGVDYDNVMVVVNVGVPFTLESIIQRVGRAGRREKETLYTSLCVIVVRNNPLEYFYIYKGVRELTDVTKLPKIPVSYTNVFVALYSALLYVLARCAKQGERLDLRSERGLKEFADKLDIAARAKQELGSEVDISDKLKELREILEGSVRSDIEGKLKALETSEKEDWLRKERDSWIAETKDVLAEIEKDLNEFPLESRKFIRKKIENVRSIISRWENAGLDAIASDDIDKVDDSFNQIRNEIPRSFNHFSLYREKLYGLLSKLYKLGRELQEIARQKRVPISSAERAILYKIGEIREALKHELIAHNIELLENIVGFKFAGTEFIDQTVFVSDEYGRQEKKESLNDVVARTPPFELTIIPFEEKYQKKISDVVGARHVWLVEPLKGEIYYLKERDKKGVEKPELIEADQFKDLLIPHRIKFADVLTLENPLMVEAWCKDSRPLYIKHGLTGTLAKRPVKGKYRLHENVMRLYSEPDSRILEATIQHLASMDKELRRKGDSWGLNLRYPLVCPLGYCISIDPYDYFCPVRRECKNAESCRNRGLWEKAKRRRRIFPKFYVSLRVRNLPEEKISSPLVYDIGTLTYDELLEEIEFAYDTVTVYLPTIGGYLLREFDIKPIGYRARTSLVYLTFNEKLLDEVLSVLLLKDKDLTELLKFKFYMYKRLKEERSPIDAALRYKQYDPGKVDVNDKEFLEYVKESLLHTLAHLLFIYLVREKVPLDPQRITYFVGSNTIYVIENSRNDGIGLVETIRNELNAVGKKKLVEDFIEWAIDFLEEHEKRVKEQQDELKKDAERYLKLISNSEIEELGRKIDKLNSDISSRVKLDYVDIVTYRHILSTEIDVSDEVSEYVLPVIHSKGKPKLCADGCEDCLVFYRGCTEAFAQSYKISRTLVEKFLNTIVNKGQIAISGKGLGDVLENLMKRAEKIVAKVPFVDDCGLSLLCEQKRRGADVEIITRGKRDVVDKLTECGVRVRLSEGSHAKIYVLETGEQRVCLHGSINLTCKSLRENEENLTISWSDSGTC